MKTIDLKIVQLIQKSNNNHNQAIAFIFGILSKKTELDDDVFCYIYNKLNDNEKYNLLKFLEGNIKNELS